MFFCRICERIVCSPLFNILIASMIFFNTYFLADYSYDEDPEYTDFKEQAERIFLIAFTFEVILKIIGLGIKRFFSDKFNILDICVILISILEVIINLTTSDQ